MKNLKTSATMALIAAAVISGCNPSKTGSVQTQHNHQQAHKNAHHEHGLPRHHRLAFMSGHVQAGLALYRQGELTMAAPHLLHPVSETHKSEREGLDALGFESEVFEQVSVALEQQRQATDIEPLLKKAEANLAHMAAQAGGTPENIITFLMDTVIEEYTIAITDGIILDVGEYQDAYGFTVVALAHASKISNNTPITKALNALLVLWNNGPVPVDTPASIAQVTAAVQNVRAAL